MSENKSPLLQQNTLLGKVKKLIGVEPGTKLQPMIAYNSAIFFSGGGPYVMGCYLLPFLTKVEGLTTAQYGTVALFSCVCDAITDPIMGIITDRTRHRDGRHRPYLKWGVIPAMIAFFLMWNSFGISDRCQGGNTTPVMIYYICAYMFYKTVSTMIMVPHTAMLPGIAPGYNLRTQ
ncbi:MAG: MFS transporter, partial [Clostridia bacterium]|nr:MFS transporter [Clostridia bacterium]